MRSLVLILACGACGDDPSAVSVDAAGAADTAVAAFCDGTPHEVGQGIINGIAVDASGRLLAVGTQTSPAQTMFVRRLLATGDPDPAFGDGGLATIATSGPLADGHAVAVRADGTIIAGGGIEAPTSLKPFVVGLTDAGAPTGLKLTDPASPDSTVARIEVQGAAVVVSTDNTMRRVTAAGAYDPAFGTSGTLTLDGPAAVSDTGIVIAVEQLDSVVTYRMTPDGATVANSSTMVAVPDAWGVTATLSHADRITFIGKTSDAGAFDAVLGRVLATNTADPVVELGALDVRTAIERADGGLLLAGEADGIVVLAPDGTLDRKLALGSDPTKWSLTSVADWNGHPTGAGTLSGGHAFVACFP